MASSLNGSPRFRQDLNKLFLRTFDFSVRALFGAMFAILHKGRAVVRGKHSLSWMIRWVLTSACLLVSAGAHATPPLAEVTAVEHSVSKDSVRVVVRFNAAVQYVGGTATDPFRLYFDLHGTRPGATLSASTTVGDTVVQRVRLGQYQPGITRIVVDMTRSAPYTVTLLTDPPRLLIDVMRSGLPASGSHLPAAGVSRAKLATASASSVAPAPVSPPPPATPAQMPPLPPQVKYQNGLLTIVASNSTLNDVLQAVAMRTNATLDAPATLTAQRVVVALGPAPPREVLANLLQGMDYVLVGSSNDPAAIHDIILRPSSGPMGPPPIAVPAVPVEAETRGEAPGSSNPPPNQPPPPRRAPRYRQKRRNNSWRTCAACRISSRNKRRAPAAWRASAFLHAAPGGDNGIRAKLTKVANILVPARHPTSTGFASSTLLIIGIVIVILVAIVVAKTL